MDGNFGLWQPSIWYYLWFILVCDFTLSNSFFSNMFLLMNMLPVVCKWMLPYWKIKTTTTTNTTRPYVHSRALLSSHQLCAHQLCVPYASTVFGSRGFRSAGPNIWNSLPLSVTSCSTIHTFKKQLKTHLFASAFPSSWIVLDAPLIRWSPFIYLFGCPWFCACLNVCYYYYFFYTPGPARGMYKKDKISVK